MKHLLTNASGIYILSIITYMHKELNLPDLQVVILAGGLASRLGPLTSSCPKSMIRINEKPFLEHQLTWLVEKGITEIVLCLGYLYQQVVEYFGNGKRFGVKITYSIEDKPLGTAGALKLAEPVLHDSFAVMYGDSYLFLDIGSIWLKFSTASTLGLMTVYRNHGKYDNSNVSIDRTGKVALYDRHSRTQLEFIDYGMNYFRKKVLSLIPSNQYYSLEDVFGKLIEMCELTSFIASERFYEVGSPVGLADFKNYISSVKK
jgi:NDP-sugar pyrophosphorylase family protein